MTCSRNFAAGALEKMPSANAARRMAGSAPPPMRTGIGWVGRRPHRQLRELVLGSGVLHSGTEYQFPELAVRPTPSRPIPVLIGGGAEPAIRRAARLADGIFSNAPAAKFLEQVTWARQELEQRKRDPDDFRWIHYSIIYPCDDPERGWEELSDHLWHLTWKYRDMVPSANRPGPPPAAPPLAADQADRLRERAVIIGTPDQIVEELLAVRAQSGVDTAVCRPLLLRHDGVRPPARAHATPRNRDRPPSVISPAASGSWASSAPSSPASAAEAANTT